ncbi:maestro heat like repeat family member 8, partial [Chelydra serpentina]
MRVMSHLIWFPLSQAADLVAGVCSRLGSVQQPSSRTLMMKLVGLLAGEAEHLDTVISCLLDHSFPTDSNSAELWQFLSADPALGGQMMETLVVKLQSHHSSEHRASHTSAAVSHNSNIHGPIQLNLSYVSVSQGT